MFFDILWRFALGQRWYLLGAILFVVVSTSHEDKIKGSSFY